MRFQVGDKIKIYRDSLYIRNHVGEIGVITELRTYGARYSKGLPTHYVVKFECFKIPHIYMISDLDSICDKIGPANAAPIK